MAERRVSDDVGSRGGSVAASNSDEASVIRWVNQTLSVASYADIVTDLASDMGDGITLLKLVQALAKDGFPKHSPAPMMRAKKLENLQICLNFLQNQHNIRIDGVQAEDLLAGKVDSTLIICNALRNHFSSGIASSNTRSKVQRPLIYSTVEKEDMRVFTWVGELLGRDIKSYSIFYDGMILCELINVIHEGAISDVDLQKSTTSLAKLKLAESAAKKHLFITSSFDVFQVNYGGQDTKLRGFLQQCKQIYQQQAHRQGATFTKTTGERKESLKLSGRGGREAAQVSARSYEAIQKKKVEGDKSSRDPTSKYSDLYVQGASSFTNLSSRRVEHESMIRGGGGRGGVGTAISRNSSTSSESLDQDLFTPFMGGLDRVQSMESGIFQEQNKSWKIEQSNTLPRSASQGNLPGHGHGLHTTGPPNCPPTISRSLARSTESFHTQTFGLPSSRRSPSYVQLSSSSRTNDELSDPLSVLEERIAVLASRFLYERQDMFKQILRALVKERKKRQLAERRIEALERSSRQLMEHYDCTLIELGKQLAVMKSEMAIQKGGSSSKLVAMEIEQLKEQLAILTEGHRPSKEFSNHLSAPAATAHNTLFLRKRTGSKVTTEEAGVQSSAPGDTDLLAAYSKGSAASYKKLSHFFGEAPPRVEDLESLLEELGYMHLLPKLQAHNISLAELRTLTEEHLETIGIPLGARVRLLEEVKKLEPIEESHLRNLKISTA